MEGSPRKYEYRSFFKGFKVNTLTQPLYAGNKQEVSVRNCILKPGIGYRLLLQFQFSHAFSGPTSLTSSLKTLQPAVVTKDWLPSLAIWPTPTFAASFSIHVSGIVFFNK